MTRNEGDIGGGILADGVVTVLDSLVSRNHGWAGGGINNVGGKVTAIRSTIDGNTADAYGGGISNEGVLTLDSSTVSNNDSDHSSVCRSALSSGRLGRCCATPRRLSDL